MHTLNNVEVHCVAYEDEPTPKWGGMPYHQGSKERMRSDMWTGINGEIAWTLDGHYYLGCGNRGGREREVVYWIDEQDDVGRQPDGSDAFRKECGGVSKNAGQAKLQRRDRN